MITIQDIAIRAGVSHSTVSRALSGSPLVNDSTRERVLAIARETGYQVNSVARSLATRTTQSLGLVVPEVKNPYYPALVQHFVDHARSEGYSVLLNVSGGEQEHGVRGGLHQVLTFVRAIGARVGGVKASTTRRWSSSTSRATGSMSCR